VENFGWNFSANDYSEPECMVLSSAAMVTAAEKVQRILFSNELGDARFSVRRSTQTRPQISIVHLADVDFLARQRSLKLVSTGRRRGAILRPTFSLRDVGLAGMRWVIYTYGLP